MADVAVRTVRAQCAAHDGIDLVRFVLFGDRLLTAFEAALGAGSARAGLNASAPRTTGVAGRRGGAGWAQKRP